MALARQGCGAANVSPHRPYGIGTVRDALSAARDEALCGGPILRALVARFGATPARSAAPPTGAEGLPSDTTGVAPDLATAVAERQTESVRRDSQFTVGAKVTVRVTGIGRGEVRPIWRDSIVPTDSGDPQAVAVLHLRATWAPERRLVAVADAYGQTSGRNDPLVRAKQFRRTSGVVDFSEAYVNGKAGPLLISLGRTREGWLGRDAESLALSANGPPIDRLELSASGRHFEGRALVALLDDVVLDTLRDTLPSGTPPHRFTRFVVGHVLTWRPTRKLELSLGETALLARNTTTPDLAFLNPLMPYVVTQNDFGHEGDAQRSNLTAFAALRAQIHATALTGELLIDDIQIDAADRARIPNQLGWRMELTQGVPFFVPADLGVEYRRVDSYTYMRRYYSEVYQQYDRPLGSELGPAADMLRGFGEVWPSGVLRVAGELGLWRRGSLRIAQRPPTEAEGHAGEPFPSTTFTRPDVQRAVLGQASVQLLTPVLPVTLSVEGARVTNANNRSRASVLYTRVQLSASYAFRYP